MDEVYVVEIAATGPKGMPSDTVVQIGICRMLADGSDFDTVYDATVALDPKDLGKESLDYMMECHGIAPEELYVGVDEKTVVSEVQGIIFGKECASYNVGNVFGKYLNFEPWDCTRNLTLLPSISMRLDRDLKGRGSTSSSGRPTTRCVRETPPVSAMGGGRSISPRWPHRS